MRSVKYLKPVSNQSMVDVIGFYSIRRELRERIDKGRLMVYLKDSKVSGL